MEHSKDLPLEVEYYSNCLQICREGLSYYEKLNVEVEYRLSMMIGSTNLDEAQSIANRYRYYPDSFDKCESFIKVWEWLLPSGITSKYRECFSLMGRDLSCAYSAFMMKAGKELENTKETENVRQKFLESELENFQELLHHIKEQSNSLYKAHQDFFISKVKLDQLAILNKTSLGGDKTTQNDN